MRTATALAAATLMLACGPALALDCGKARTPVETAICASPALAALDDAMATAYGEVRALSTAAERRMLTRAQKKWIGEREANCPQSPLGVDGCIDSMTGERLKLFEGRPESGPGAGSRLIPVFIVQEGSATAYDLDLTLLRFADPQTPGERRLNAITQEIVERTPAGAHGEDSGGAIYAIADFMTLSHASPQLISVMRSFWANLGGAHGNGGISNINIDPATGRDYGIEHMVSEEAAAQLAASCRAQIIAEKAERWGSEPYDPARDDFLKDEVISEHIATLSRWSFTGRAATVSFDAYAIGPYAEGSYDCVFPMAELKALALPDAPLP